MEDDGTEGDKLSVEEKDQPEVPVVEDDGTEGDKLSAEEKEQTEAPVVEDDGTEGGARKASKTPDVTYTYPEQSKVCNKAGKRSWTLSGLHNIPRCT